MKEMLGGFRLPETSEDYPVHYVLDGQQRLTTLYGVFYSDTATTKPILAEKFSVCFVPDSESFVHSSVAPKQSINLTSILDTTKLLPELRRFSENDQQKIALVTERFKDYEFPVVTIKDRTNQEVCRVFQRINSSGTTLSTLELLAAWTWSDNFNLRSEIESLILRLGDKGYESLGEPIIMRCLSAIVSGGIEPESLVDENSQHLVTGMSTVKQAMFATVDFLEKEFSIRNSVFIPFPIMVVPLVFFFGQNLKPNADQRRMLCRWFWNCCFTQRYKAGTNSYVMEDIELMRQIVAGKNIEDMFDTKVSPEIFKRTWRINSTAAKAAICLLAQCEPRSFLNNSKVDLGNTLSAYNARQFHHIYPKAFLALSDIPFHESNVIANVCLLTASDNNEISDKDPREYFGLMPDKGRETTFNKALIPFDSRDGSKPYATFVSIRASILAEVATQLIRTAKVDLQIINNLVKSA